MAKASEATKLANENYLIQKEILEKQGYVPEKKTVSIVKANVVAAIICVLTAVVLNAIYVLKWGQISTEFSLSTVILFICFIISIPVHEFLHGLGFAIFCKDGWHSIRFGIMREYLTPYCSCKEPLEKWHYLFGGLLPFIVLGIIPAIIAIAAQFYGLLIFSILSIACAGGDLMIAKMLLGCGDGKILDHPSEAGFYYFHK